VVPELGTLTRREVAALVGVAPINCDSGTKTGRRYIQGGRHAARQCLYMAALAAGRWNDVIRTQYQQLVARGKKPKVAIVANMRKLLIHFNSRMRNHLAGPTGAVPRPS
jgi:transposase